MATPPRICITNFNSGATIPIGAPFVLSGTVDIACNVSATIADTGQVVSSAGPTACLGPAPINWNLNLTAPANPTTIVVTASGKYDAVNGTGSHTIQLKVV